MWARTECAKLPQHLHSVWQVTDRSTSRRPLTFVWERSFRGEAGPVARCLFMRWFILLTEGPKRSRTYCLSLMNNTDKCERGNKCGEQRSRQRELDGAQKCFACKCNFNTRWTAPCQELAVGLLRVWNRTLARMRGVFFVFSRCCKCPTGSDVPLKRKWSISVSRAIYLILEELQARLM